LFDVNIENSFQKLCFARVCLAGSITVCSCAQEVSRKLCAGAKLKMRRRNREKNAIATWRQCFCPPGARFVAAGTAFTTEAAVFYCFNFRGVFVHVVTG
jgi:hypothetical protein